MKIKKLAIRNIASIEEADIDFTKDLVDAVTGDPASIFLISGDTGVGKSVILDSIALALYGTTPRLESVVNSQSNKFIDARGEEVKIKSVEQYTRLGISEKDPCYCEVVYEGNDGREYCSRLTLGYKLGNNKVLRNRASSMSLTVGSDKYNNKDEVKELNKSAIGLTFKQFNRMVLLAQGQFAAFLTGKKEERQEILEQLTNTEHFSDYGDAIERLFKKAKADYVTKEGLWEQAKEYVKPDEIVADWKRELAEVEEEEKRNNKAMTDVGNQIEAVKEIEAATEKIQQSSDAKTQWKGFMDGKEYQEAQAAIKDWDGTVTERQRLQDMRNDQRDLDKARQQAKQLADQFAILLADLAFRSDDIRRRKADMAKLDAWLQEREDRKDLYDHADGTVVKLGNLKGLLESIDGFQRKVAEESGRTEALKRDEAARKEQFEAATKHLENKQREIDALLEEQQELDPQETNAELNALPQKSGKLDNLSSDISALAGYKQALEELKTAIREDEKRLASLDEEVNGAITAKNTAREKHDIAQRCYSIMSSSADDLLVNLREQMQKEKIDICPLCGQRIDAYTENYTTKLTELDEVRAEALKKLEEAEETLKSVKEKRDNFAGQLDQKKKEAEQKRMDISAKEDGIRKVALDVGLDPRTDLLGQIQTAKETLVNRKESLKKRQERLTEIGQSITRLTEERKLLEKEKDGAYKEFQEANGLVSKNKKEIEDNQQWKSKAENEKALLSDELSKAMDAIYPDWASDLEATISSLGADAKEYREMAKVARETHTSIENSERDISTFHGCRDSILRLFPDWKKTMVPASHASADIVQEWTTMNSDVSSVHATIEEHERDIRDYREVLDSWYQSTGRDEAALDAIKALEPKLQSFRDLVKNTEDKYRDACNDNADAQKEKGDSMAKLGITEESDIPVIKDLEAEKADLNTVHDGIVSRKATIQGKLKENEDNQGKLDEKKRDLDKAEAVFNKWEPINRHFGGYRFRTLVQTYILRPLLNNANIYLKEITDRYKLTCSEDNEQLAILVQDRYNKDQIRSATVLSGGERFMISLALSLALSSLNRPDLNVNILFIDEGFGTLDKTSLESVMATLEKLQEIAGESNRRVGIISHREELDERIPTQVHVVKKGEGRSRIQFVIGGTPV